MPDQTLHPQNSVTLIGSGAAGTILGGGGKYEIMQVGQPAYINHITVALFGLTLRNGQNQAGGALYNSPNALAVLTNCTFSGNSDTGSGENKPYFGPGGGAINNDGGTATLTNCTFSQNTAPNNFGGAFFNGVSSPVFKNCVFTQNSAKYGGAILNFGNATLTGCTVSGNSATYGTLFNQQSYDDQSNIVYAGMTLTNDILYGDSPGKLYQVSSSNSVSISYCDLQGGVPSGVTDGGGNFSANPLFVSAASGNLHLQSGSPCIGAGTINASNYSPYDRDGAPRSSPPTVGAYEGRKINTQTSIASSLNPAAVGQSVTFTATVTNLDPNSSAPVGTVQFQINGTNHGGPVSLGANGMAQFTTPPPEAASTIFASFVSADAAHTNSSASVQQIVNVQTKLQLYSDPNPGYATGATFTAVISNPDPNGPVPYGAVDFYVDGNREAESVGVDRYGNAQFQDILGGDLPPGPHTIQAYFYGYSGFLNSSASLIQTTIASVTGVSVGWGKQNTPLTSSAALPWLGIKTLVVTLDGPAGLAAGDITLTGKAVASYGPITLSQSGSVYTLTLAKSITVPDRLTLTVGNSGVNPYSTSFSVLPGDANGDGAVNASDMALVKNAIGGTYNQTDDIDGSGAVDITDYNAVRQRVGAKLP